MYAFSGKKIDLFHTYFLPEKENHLVSHMQKETK